MVTVEAKLLVHRVRSNVFLVLGVKGPGLLQENMAKKKARWSGMVSFSIEHIQGVSQFVQFVDILHFGMIYFKEIKSRGHRCGDRGG